MKRFIILTTLFLAAVISISAQDTALDTESLIFGMNLNLVGYIPYSSGHSVGIEIGKGNFNCEINATFPYSLSSGGFGSLITLNYFGHSRIGGFYAGGGVGFSSFQKDRLSITAGLNTGYKFITRSGLYFRTGGFVGYDFAGMLNLPDYDTFPIYFKPDIAVGVTMVNANMESKASENWNILEREIRERNPPQRETRDRNTPERETRERNPPRQVAEKTSDHFSMSVGGGLLFDMSLGNGTIQDLLEAGLLETGMNNTVIGAFAFFDFTYAVVDLSFGYGMITQSIKGEFFGEKFEETLEGDRMLQLGFGILGKYPINLGNLGLFTFFPMLGINYNIALLYMFENGDNYNDSSDNASAMKDLSQFSILAGIGFDFPFNNTIYLRGEALFNLRFPNKTINDFIKETENVKAVLGVGPRIKIGFGLNLF